MQESRPATAKSALPIILIAAVVQGWALYALHQSIKHQFWPATDSAWLIALYSLALFVPLTFQLLSEYAKSKTQWVLLTSLGLAYFYFGWHYGANVHQESTSQFITSGEYFPMAFVMGLLWLLLLPFLQARLSTGRWAVPYALLFTTAWRNKLMLAEAGLFTGLFWLLLLLWQTLFHMLGIEYFRELFEEPLFVYPVTTIVFGIALHLIGSVERLTAAILEQLLNVLKWLAVVAGVILTLFTIALVLKLPGLVFHGQKAIGAAWLLWLVAVIVLLINSAYRDGSVVQPYPTWIAFALRCIIPLTVIIAFTALYALIVRTRHFGLTVERVWAFVVAGSALLYSISYSIAAVGKGQWLEGIGRMNVLVAVVLIATIAGTLTPLLSPYRLAANSQYRIALVAPVVGAGEANVRSTPFHYLRFDAGQYGKRKLSELSVLKNHPDAERIRTAALAALNSTSRWQAIPVDANDVLNRMKIFPPGHQLDAKLRQKLMDEIGKMSKGYMLTNSSNESPAGLFVDLRDDKTEEFVLLYQYGGSVYQQIGEDWELKGSALRDDQQSLNWKSLLNDLDEGKVTTAIPDWKRLNIGHYQYRVGAPRENSVAAKSD